MRISYKLELDLKTKSTETKLRPNFEWAKLQARFPVLDLYYNKSLLLIVYYYELQTNLII